MISSYLNTHSEMNLPSYKEPEGVKKWDPVVNAYKMDALKEFMDEEAISTFQRLKKDGFNGGVIVIRKKILEKSSLADCIIIEDKTINFDEKKFRVLGVSKGTIESKSTHVLAYSIANAQKKGNKILFGEKILFS